MTLYCRYVHGHRVVLPPAAESALHTSGDTQREQELRVLDFNVYPKRMDDPCNEMSPYGPSDSCNQEPCDVPRWRHEVITEPSYIDARELFVDIVKTHLPYTVTARRGVWRYTGFMIDEERIVGMKVCIFFVYERMSLLLIPCYRTLFSLMLVILTYSHCE